MQARLSVGAHLARRHHRNVGRRRVSSNIPARVVRHLAVVRLGHLHVRHLGHLAVVHLLYAIELYAIDLYDGDDASLLH